MSDVTSEPDSDAMSDGSEAEEYSQDAAIEAIRDYYAFLCTMYLDPARVVEPPPSGWPEITAERFQHMNKSDKVIELLRNLPYISTSEQDPDVAHGFSNCVFADWAREARGPSNFPQQTPEQEGESWRIGSEVYEYEDVPPYVIGLTLGGARNETLLLDTEIGVIHWIECSDELKRWWKLYLDGRMEPHFASRSGQEGENEEGEDEQERDYKIVKHVSSDYFANDWEVEEEREWRSRGGTWEIADFFEILKAQFRSLDFVPVSDCKVVDTRTNWVGFNDLRTEVRGIWRDFGWPEAAVAAAEGEGSNSEANFDKTACLAKIEHVVRQTFGDTRAI
ncbi:hypothetical protein LIA77_09116 [Sarocladium implicatum]|nr:hypothetical protein LIA77_09116 [Sarocladium implicatum]